MCVVPHLGVQTPRPGDASCVRGREESSCDCQPLPPAMMFHTVHKPPLPAGRQHQGPHTPELGTWWNFHARSGPLGQGDSCGVQGLVPRPCRAHHQHLGFALVLVPGATGWAQWQGPNPFSGVGAITGSAAVGTVVALSGHGTSCGSPPCLWLGLSSPHACCCLHLDTHVPAVPCAAGHLQ